jgi:hypothetical protein
MFTHQFLVKRVRHNNDYATTEDDKQRQRSRKEVKKSKGYICGDAANDEECANIRRRF